MPPEGPKVLPLFFTFNPANIQYIANLSSLRQQENFSYFQSAFIDNSRNAASLLITLPVTRQTISMLPGWQGYLGLLLSNEPEITFDSVTLVDTLVKIHLLNYPMSNHTWPTV
jgi:hypothetical protein